MQRFVLGNVLSASRRQLLTSRLVANTTGGATKAAIAALG
jgi:hypothetical protein